MSTSDAMLVFFGGILAGIINAMAGGGSLITVPLLSLAGLEGLLANGTNRVAVMLQCVASGYGYSRSKVVTARRAAPIVIPAVVGGFVGAIVVSGLDDRVFERLFGFIMLPMLVLSLRPAKSLIGEPKPWPMWLTSGVFFLVGMYAGLVQAGVGLILLMVLSRAGFNLIEGNAIKTYVNLFVSIVAVATFVAQGQVRWVPALILSAGMALGGYTGSQVAVQGGERVIRPVLAVSVLVLAAKMIGLF